MNAKQNWTINGLDSKNGVNRFQLKKENNSGHPKQGIQRKGGYIVTVRLCQGRGEGKDDNKGRTGGEAMS